MLVINEKATIATIKSKLLKYREYLVTLPSSKLPKITASYSLVPPQNTNTFSSKTEDVAIKRVMYEQERNKFMDRIHNAVDELPEQERIIVVQSYLLLDKRSDIAICVDLHMSERQYYRVKKRALLKLATFLNAEIYK